GRVGWRISLPAMMAYWSELARPIVLPRSGTPTTLLRAVKTDPPYVPAALVDGLGTAGGDRRRGAGTAMTAVTDADVERVRALVSAIPPGRVSTYGDIASAAG